MEKILITALFSIIPFTSISHPHEPDPFTTYIQEKLIELGYLDVSTGVNDKTTQSAIKLFQSRSGLVVDGMVGDETFTQLMLSEKSSKIDEVIISNTQDITSSQDIESPKWDTESPPYASEIGTLFNLNLPSVSDNVGITTYEVYVNGVLASYANISESRLLVTPVYDMTCSDQIVYVIAYDAAGNSSRSPHFTIPQKQQCNTSYSSGNSVSAVFLVSFGSSGSGDESAQSVHILSGADANIYCVSTRKYMDTLC